MEKTLVFKKDIKVEDLIKDRSGSNERVMSVIRDMKQKTLKFTQFDKDKMMELHKPRDLSQESRSTHSHQLLTIHDESQDKLLVNATSNPYDDDIDDSDYEIRPNNKQQNNQQSQKKLTQNGSQLQKQAMPKQASAQKEQKQHKYFYEQFLQETRRMTIDSGRNQARKYFSSFKTVSRDQRDHEANKMRLQIPGVGKYYPKFKVTETLQPTMTIAKAQLNRTRNLMGSEDYIQYQDTNKHLNQSHLDTQQSNLQDKPSQYGNLLESQKLRSKSQVKNDYQAHVNESDHQEPHSFEHSGTQNMSLNMIQKRRHQNSMHMQQAESPKMREGWNHAHGMLDLNKQSERKFVFEGHIRINEHRFDNIQLPKICSNNRKVVGDLNFGKGSPRRELFKLPDYQPSYQPKYDSVQQREPKYVNMNIRPLKDLLHKIE